MIKKGSFLSTVPFIRIQLLVSGSVTDCKKETTKNIGKNFPDQKCHFALKEKTTYKLVNKKV